MRMCMARKVKNRSAYAEVLAQLVAECQRIHALRLRRILDLEAMLVGSSYEVY